MPLFVAPLAGALSDRIGGRPLMIAGLALQAIALASIAALASPTVPYDELVPGFLLARVGMAFVFAPMTNMVLGAVDSTETGRASGASNAIRELGGVFGVAVLAAVFSAGGGYASPSSFVAGLGPAIVAGAAAMALAALAAMLLPTAARRRRGRHVGGVPSARPSLIHAETNLARSAKEELDDDEGDPAATGSRGLSAEHGADGRRCLGRRSLPAKWLAIQRPEFSTHPREGN